MYINKKILSAYLLLLPVSLLPASYAYADSAKQVVSDSAITTSVKLKYSANPILNPFDINVTTKHGVVFLKGKVNADSQYENAITLAEAVDGVSDVNTNELTVAQSHSVMADLAITAKIKAKLIKEKLLAADKVPYWGIHIETNNRIVYLTGVAQSEQEKDNVMRVAESIKGVKSVKSDVSVEA